LENWAAPIVLILAGFLLGWVVWRADGVGPLFTQASKYPTLAEFWPVFVPSLTGMVGFWATLSLNIPDFTRFGRGQREQMLGQALGLPTTMLAFSAMAVVITSASAAILHGVPMSDLWNPEVVLGFMTSASPPPGATDPLIASGLTRAIVAVIAVLGVVIATVSVNIAANVVSPANDFANLAPKWISFKIGGLITGILGILCLPWKLLANADTYINGWLVGYSALLGPVAGIMIADYFIVRKRELDVPDLYRVNGRYGAWNPVALVALGLGILPNLPGFLKGIHVLQAIPSVFESLYVYAWFTGLAIAGGTYVAGMKLTSK